ncbi:MAG: hypothetical protein ACK5IC_01585, partial [Moheibacter sp.]
MKATDNRTQKQSISKICREFKLQRDAYYKFKNRFASRENWEAKIVGVVNQRRKILPREGVRKLMIALEKEFEQHQISIG